MMMMMMMMMKMMVVVVMMIMVMMMTMKFIDDAIRRRERFSGKQVLACRPNPRQIAKYNPIPPGDGVVLSDFGEEGRHARTCLPKNASRRI